MPAGFRTHYPPERILVVDDQPENYACGYGHLVRVRGWTGDPDDDELSSLAEYLVRLSQVADLRRVEKRGWRSSLSGVRT